MHRGAQSAGDAAELWRRRCAKSSAASTRTCRSSTCGRWRRSTGCARSASSTCWSTTVGAMGLMGLGAGDRRAVRPRRLRGDAGARAKSASGWRSAPTAPTVLRMVLRQGVALAVVGLVVGLAGERRRGRAACGRVPQRRRPARRRRRSCWSRAVVLAVTLLADLHSGAPRLANRSDEGAALRVGTFRGHADIPQNSQRYADQAHFKAPSPQAGGAAAPPGT